MPLKTALIVVTINSVALMPYRVPLRDGPAELGITAVAFPASHPRHNAILLPIVVLVYKRPPRVAVTLRVICTNAVIVLTSPQTPVRV